MLFVDDHQSVRTHDSNIHVYPLVQGYKLQIETSHLQPRIGLVSNFRVPI